MEILDKANEMFGEVVSRRIEDTKAHIQELSNAQRAEVQEIANCYLNRFIWNFSQIDRDEEYIKVGGPKLKERIGTADRQYQKLEKELSSAKRRLQLLESIQKQQRKVPYRPNHSLIDAAESSPDLPHYGSHIYAVPLAIAR
jgi:hypothetical protein